MVYEQQLMFFSVICIYNCDHPFFVLGKYEIPLTEQTQESCNRKQLLHISGAEDDH